MLSPFQHCHALSHCWHMRTAYANCTYRALFGIVSGLHPHTQVVKCCHIVTCVVISTQILCLLFTMLSQPVNAMPLHGPFCSVSANALTYTESVGTCDSPTHPCQLSAAARTLVSPWELTLQAPPRLTRQPPQAPALPETFPAMTPDDVQGPRNHPHQPPPPPGQHQERPQAAALQQPSATPVAPEGVPGKQR